MFAWGLNSRGQLGTGDTTNVGDGLGVLMANLAPVDLGGAIATAITAGEAHTCAVLNTGALRCWGKGDHGQLGSSSSAASLTAGDPVVFPLPTAPCIAGRIEATVGPATARWSLPVRPAAVGEVAL